MFTKPQIVAGFILLLGTAHNLPAQQTPTNRLVQVVVTDPFNRIVSGLEQQNFDIVENGVPRPITSLDASSPVSIAVVGAALPDIAKLKLPEDELIQAQSISEAVRGLASSKNPR